MLIINSSWTNRLLIAVPLVIAALLNALMLGVEHLHLRLDYIARYGFVFFGPWVWPAANVADIADHLNGQNPRLGGFLWYVAILWIPSVLYSLWVLLLLVVLRIAARRLLNHLDPYVAQAFKRM